MNRDSVFHEQLQFLHFSLSGKMIQRWAIKSNSERALHYLPGGIKGREVRGSGTEVFAEETPLNLPTESGECIGNDGKPSTLRLVHYE